MGPVRIAVVSGDRLFRDGLSQILNSQPAFMVAADGDGATPSGGDVDILVVDARSLTTPLEQTSHASPGPHVILVNAPDDDAWAADAISRGACGILPRASGADDLVNAIHVVHDGGVWARRSWLTPYADRSERAKREAPPAPSRLDAGGVPWLAGQLSRREREVLFHAATGVGNKELASRLAISESTVKVHMTRIFQKMGVSGRAELVAACHGLRPSTGTPVVRPSA